MAGLHRLACCCGEVGLGACCLTAELIDEVEVTILAQGAGGNVLCAWFPNELPGSTNVFCAGGFGGSVTNQAQCDFNAEFWQNRCATRSTDPLFNSNINVIGTFFPERTCGNPQTDDRALTFEECGIETTITEVACCNYNPPLDNGGPDFDLELPIAHEVTGCNDMEDEGDGPSASFICLNQGGRPVGGLSCDEFDIDEVCKPVYVFECNKCTKDSGFVDGSGSPIPEGEDLPDSVTVHFGGGSLCPNPFKMCGCNHVVADDEGDGFHCETSLHHAICTKPFRNMVLGVARGSHSLPHLGGCAYATDIDVEMDCDPFGLGTITLTARIHVGFTLHAGGGGAISLGIQGGMPSSTSSEGSHGGACSYEGEPPWFSFPNLDLHHCVPGGVW